MALVKTKSVKIRRSRVLPSRFIITETFVSDSQFDGGIGKVTWDSSNLREAIATIFNSKQPGYELDIKLTV